MCFVFQRLSIFCSGLGWCHNSWLQPAFKWDLMEMFGNCTPTERGQQCCKCSAEPLKKKKTTTCCFLLKKQHGHYIIPKFLWGLSQGSGDGFIRNNHELGKKRIQNAEKPTKRESNCKKNIAGRVKPWKKQREKWWHRRFPNHIKYILLL